MVRRTNNSGKLLPSDRSKLPISGINFRRLVGPRAKLNHSLKSLTHEISSIVGELEASKLREEGLKLALVEMKKSILDTSRGCESVQTANRLGRIHDRIDEVLERSEP